jgi:hypothetical protein
VTAVQAAHEDLKAQQGAVLVTGGGLSLETDEMSTAAASWGMASLGVAKAAQHKLVHIMHKALAADGIYVAEVTVMGGVSWWLVQAAALCTDCLVACWLRAGCSLVQWWLASALRSHAL